MNDILKMKIKRSAKAFKDGVKESVIEAVDDVKHGCEKALEWCVDHPQEFAILASLAASGVGIAKKAIHANTAQKQIKEEQRHRDYDVYDHSTGCYYTTKTKMTNKDILKMAELQRDYGISKGEALRMMNKI